MKEIVGYAAFCLLIIFIVFSSGCVSGPQVESFDECVAMGYPVMEIYPARCSTPDGRTFIEEIETTRHVCTEEEKQAQACTMEYAPVCGFKSGESQTYGNGCGACAGGADYWKYGECAGMSLEEARQAAMASVCTEEGTLTEEAFYNANSRTWWIDIEPNEEKQGCNPACVVSEDRTAEINWRCTGALPP